MIFDAATFLAGLFGSASPICPSGLPEDMEHAYEERAAIKEFCGNIPRNEAERQAWAEVVAA